MRATLLVLGLVLVSSNALAEDAKPAPTPAPAAKPAKPATRNDVAVGAALARTDKGVTLVQTGTATNTTQAAPAPAASARTADGMVTTKSGAGLAEISVARVASSDDAGEARDVGAAVGAPTAKAQKPMASVRLHRKLDVQKVMASIAPTLQSCPQSNGPVTVAVNLELAPTGAVEAADVAPGSLSNAATKCVSSAFQAVKFGAPGGQGVRLVLPIAVGSTTVAAR